MLQMLYSWKAVIKGSPRDTHKRWSPFGARCIIKCRNLLLFQDWNSAAAPTFFFPLWGTKIFFFMIAIDYTWSLFFRVLNFYVFKWKELQNDFNQKWLCLMQTRFSYLHAWVMQLMSKPQIVDKWSFDCVNGVCQNQRKFLSNESLIHALMVLFSIQSLKPRHKIGSSILWFSAFLSSQWWIKMHRNEGEFFQEKVFGISSR